MTATIKLTLEENGQEVEREATFDGEQWASDDDFVKEFLDNYTQNWSLRRYYPNAVAGTALEVVEDLRESLDAEFVRSDQIDYSDEPENAIY